MRTLCLLALATLVGGCDPQRVTIGMDEDLATPQQELGGPRDMEVATTGDMTVCPIGRTFCSGTCVNLLLDGAHCGDCNHACPNGQLCSNGSCSKTCAAPLIPCGMACVDPRIDDDNCGACGTVCPSVANGTRGCAGSACTIGACNPGFRDCDGQVQDGCEANVDTDLANCGACQNACPNYSNAARVCTNGGCALGACNSGFRDCDGQAQNGCEAAINTDVANCGSCGNVCPGNQICSNGQCSVNCLLPDITCSMMCVDPRSDANNCGACANVCGVIAHGTSSCVSSACSVSSCDTGFGDCDHQENNGCEVDINGDVNNCGTCNKVCAAIAHGTVSCMAGNCALGQCNANFADCDKMLTNGCEASLLSDVSNCGQCGRACQAPNATSSCAAGACGIASCNLNFGDCDQNPANGCEANLKSDANNCGICGRRCGWNGCQAGVCKPGTLFFAAAVSYPVAGLGGAESLAAADWNGDGKIDLAAANYLGNGVSTLLGNGDGSFQAPKNIAAGPSPYAIVAGDWNGDSKPDLATAHLVDGQVSLLLGNGDGSFKGFQSFGAGTETQSLAVSDWNADGKSDLVVADYGSNVQGTENVSVFLGKGDGTLQSLGPTLFQSGSHPNTVALGDFNGDSRLDLAVACFSGAQVRILFNGGNGNFVYNNGTSLGTGFGTTPQFLVAGDWDGDGRADLAVIYSGSDTVDIFLGKGDGTFLPAKPFSAKRPSSIAVGDLNGDGIPDLALANSDAVGVLLGNGDGTFQPRVSFGAGTGPLSVIVGDWNGDTKPDLAVASVTSEDISILLNISQ